MPDRFRSSPEPSTLALLGFGAAGLIGYTWRRKRPLLNVC
jgi:hypothetical protein